MAEITYNDIDTEIPSNVTPHFYINDAPNTDVKKSGRPRKFPNIEARSKYYKDNKYNLKYYYNKLKCPCKCDICDYTFSSMNALNAHKINNKKCNILKETLDFLTPEQRDKIKEKIHKNK